MFLSAIKWTKFDDLRFCVKMSLKKGLARIRGMRRALTDEEQDTVAKAIVEHLELSRVDQRLSRAYWLESPLDLSSNWKIEAGRPLGGHGQGIIPKFDEGDGE
jgi:hypothetical protein